MSYRISPCVAHRRFETGGYMGRMNSTRSAALLAVAYASLVALTSQAFGAEQDQEAGAYGWRSHAQDPGPRANPPSAIPDPVSGLNANEMALFRESLLRVSELEGTCDTCAQ